MDIFCPYPASCNLHYEKMSDGTVKCIEEEIPFKIPDSWVWCRLNDVIQLFSGQDFSPDKYNDKGDGIPYITGASNMDKGAVIINRWTQYPQVHACAGDLLLTCKGAGVGKMAFLHETDVHIARQIMALRPNKMLPKVYMKTVVSARIESVISQANGLIPGIKREVILGFLFPLPPIDEQQRISDAVSLAFEQIETIESEKADLQSIIAHAKSKILDLAIRGKLVPQNPDDEPASTLLERVRAEKEELIKQGKIKRDKNESYIFRGDDKSYYERIGNHETKIDGALPYQVPIGWQWARNKTVYLFNLGGGTPSKAKPEYWNGNIGWASVKDITEGAIYLNHTKDQISQDGLDNSPSNIVPQGNIVVCTRISLDRIVITNIDVAINQDLRGIILPEQIEKLFYLYYYKTLTVEGQGSTVKGITQNEFESFLIPIPPLPEQQRIVTAINDAFLQLDAIAEALT